MVLPRHARTLSLPNGLIRLGQCGALPLPSITKQEHTCPTVHALQRPSRNDRKSDHGLPISDFLLLTLWLVQGTGRFKGYALVKMPRRKLRGIAEISIVGPGITRVPRVGLGVSPEPSGPLSAGRQDQHARRVRSPDQHKPSRSKLREMNPRELQNPNNCIGETGRTFLPQRIQTPPITFR